MATDHGDMRLIPGAYEVRAPRPTGSVALDTTYPVTATVTGALPSPHHPATFFGRAGAAFGSLCAALALILLLGAIPKALAYLLAWLG
jgi:hypothetical protein